MTNYLTPSAGSDTAFDAWLATGVLDDVERRVRFEVDVLDLVLMLRVGYRAGWHDRGQQPTTPVPAPEPATQRPMALWADQPRLWAGLEMAT